MKFDINATLTRLENKLAKLGLPAGPDQLINHKTILGFFLGIVGALIGWAITEPGREDFTFWRDTLILSAVGCFIWFFVISLDNLFERSARAVINGLKKAPYAPLVIVATVVLVKLALASPEAREQAIPFLQSNQPQSLKIFVLDVSGSMQGYSLETLKDAVNVYVDKVKENPARLRPELACVIFSDSARLLQGPTKDYSLFMRQVQGIQAGGATNIAEGLEIARDVSKSYGQAKSGTASTEVILVSDGQPNRPTSATDQQYPFTSIKAVLPFFASNRIPIHAVGAGKEYVRSLMESVSSETKGKFVPADNVDKLPQVFKELAGLTQADGEATAKLPLRFRVLGWTVIGLVIGLCCAIPRKSLRAIAIGMLGGVVGGGLGAMFFEGFRVTVAHFGIKSGIFNRFGGFLILGASVGFAVPFVESGFKSAWLRIIRGLGEGRLIILDRSPMILGRHELIDIPIFGDPQIELKNVRLEKRGNSLQVETLGPDNLLIKDVKARSGTLTHQDTFTVGNTKFVYLNKREGIAEDKLPEKDRMPDRMPKPRPVGTEAANASAEAAHRRLPIFLVLDASGSMSGAPIKAVNIGLKDFEAAIKSDPYAINTTYISIIVYGNKVQQLMPLTEASRFAAPQLKAKGDPSLGQAITILGQSLVGEVKAAGTQNPGDFKPLIFLIAAGEPTDDWAGPAENFKTLATQRSANLIAIGCGPNVGARTLKQVGKVALVMPNMAPDGIKGLFEWIIQSVKAASRSASMQASTGQEGGGAQLPPLPSGIEVAR